jgi:hypothetical protein
MLLLLLISLLVTCRADWSGLFESLQALPLPYSSLPNASLTLPTLTAATQILIVGGRGISASIARIFVNLGATVSVTTTSLAGYSLAANGLPTSVNVFELEYGTDDEERNYRHLVRVYRERMGARNPDYIVDCGLTVYSGNTVDFDATMRRRAMRMYIEDPIGLEEAFLAHNDPNQRVIHSSCLSTAGFNPAPLFQEFYDTGKQFKFSHILGSNAAQLHPNWLRVGVACSFTNTTWYLTAQNPSVAKGDKLQIAFQAIIAGATSQGNSPDTVALAHAQALLLRQELNDETLFLSEPPAGTAFSQAFNWARTYLTGKQYVTFFQQFALAALHLNLTDH